jgi:ABC-type Fe3+/spermidine/putrescine transport system ATPase subunit
MSFLELKNIYYSIVKNDILKNINLNVEDGQFFSILGPSGAGKTSIFRIITGALQADKGQILLDNNIINDVPMEKREITMVHQSKQLFPHMSILDNIQFGMKIKKLEKNEIIQKTDDLLQLFNMKKHIKKYPYQLSGGQQQLVALMRALAVDPKILLLDEPFTGLDNNLKNYMRNFILEIQKKLKITMVMITHDKEDAFFMSDKIAFIFKGEIVLIETPRNLSNKTKIEVVNNYLGDIILLDGGRIVFLDKIIDVVNEKKSYEMYSK